MINTISTKEQQLKNTYFSIGTGSEVILVMGSCRSVQYMNYFNEWNEANGNRFTINFIDPFNWHWDEKDERTDYDKKLLELETDSRLLSMLKSVNIFIHEYYSHAGMFNVNKNEHKNIYQYGMNPSIDICLPNFNNIFILVADIASFDSEIRSLAFQDFNSTGKLSLQTLDKIEKVSEINIQKFYDVCAMSDVPEMADYFRDNFKKERLFWTNNHVAKGFTLAIFKFINEKFLHLDLSKGFNPDHEDMFANNYVHLSEYDKGFEYNEEVVPLISKLFF